MPLDFPNSPTIGQTFSSGTRKWTWTGEQWSAANIIEIEVPPSSFRNKIINGDMRIDQRNAGASYIPPTGGGLRYTIDRWGVQSQITNSNYITTQQLSLTPPPGFVNYLNITVNTAQTLGSSIFDYYILRQAIEGNNVRDLGWGTSSPKTTTLSFWVRSSLTGLFGGHLTNATSSRFYTFTYNITQANTWQYVTVTIPGDTVGPWSTDTSVGIYVTWVLGVGTGNNAGVPNSWVSYAGGGATPTPVGTTGLTNFLGTQGATFQITGVQFEVGTIATPFEQRPIGTELALCQRYFQVYDLTNYRSAIVSTNFGDGGSPHIVITTNHNMRTTPAILLRSGAMTTAWPGTAATTRTVIWYSTNYHIGARILNFGSPYYGEAISSAAIITADAEL